MMLSPKRRAALHRTLAWSGLALMALSIFFLAFSRGREAPPVSERLTPARLPIVSLVVIDAGHGGRDSGAIHNGVLEKDLTLDVARRVEGLARVRSFRTMLTRASDTWVSLSERAAAANRENDCVFVSIHFDQGSRATATGVQTFYGARQVSKASLQTWLPFLKPPAPAAAELESETLANFIQQALVAHTHATNRGVRSEQFFVVANVRHPAVLVEGGFLSNNEEIGKLEKEEYRQELAAAITEGIVRYRDAAREREQAPAVALSSAE